jgi:tetratricopeptide (TPR) repeat protein
MNKWILSSTAIFIFFIVLFINLNNNSVATTRTNTDLDSVTNEEMEKVINDNPDIYPMRIALANRYFDEINYSNALPHYMYVAENSDDNELKSFALSQIAWMVFESNNIEVAIDYLDEALRINENSIIAKSYLGIIYLQDPITRSDGRELLNEILSSNKLSSEDRNFVEELVSQYES